jgi:GT2 family glycosyltransferase
MVKDKVLFLISAYNSSEYTKLNVEYLQRVTDVDLEILVVDDCSTDDTVEWCKENNVKVFEKEEGRGNTHSWNMAYEYFKKNEEFNYFVNANHDIVVPNGALSQLIETQKRWPGTTVCPMGNKIGVGHAPVQYVGNYFDGFADASSNYENTQQIQDGLVATKENLRKAKDLYMIDPIRMKHFNGFLFMHSREICKYEREDGNLYDPKHLMCKNEDEFNWKVMLPNDDHPILCKTAYVYHFKAVSKGSSIYFEDHQVDEFLAKRKELARK